MADSSRTFTPRTLIQLAIFIVVVPFLPLLISWQWAWWQAWVYAIVAVLGFVISRALAVRQHPDLLAERARMTRHQDAKSWDKLLAPLVALGGGLIPLAAGLAARFGWSADFGLTVEVVALLPAVALIVVLVIRTDLEDQTLQAELAGYRDYAERVPYRWLPGIW